MIYRKYFKIVMVGNTKDGTRASVVTEIENGPKMKMKNLRIQKKDQR